MDICNIENKPSVCFQQLQIINDLIKQNRPQMDSVADKDIVILFGQTGSGKSTTVNYLSGLKMQRERIQLYSEELKEDYFEKVIKVAEGQTEVAKIGIGFKSETKIMSSNKIFGKNEKNILLFDTPGILDTEGSLTDIANSISIVKTLLNAQSVKIILIIGFKSLSNKDGRAKSVKDIVTLYTQLIKDIQSCKESIMIGYTHLEEGSEIEDVKYSIAGILNNKSLDQQSKNFLEIAYNSLKENQSCLIYPLKGGDERDEIIEKLMNMKPILREDSNNFFEYALIEETKIKFINMLESVKNETRQFFERLLYDEVTKRVIVFGNLQHDMNFIFIKNIFNEIIEFLIKVDLLRRTNECLEQFKDSQEGISELSQKLISQSAQYISWVETVKSIDKRFHAKLPSFSSLYTTIYGTLSDIYEKRFSPSQIVMMTSLKKLKSVYCNASLVNDLLCEYNKYNEKQQILDPLNHQPIKYPLQQNLYQLACEFVKEKLDIDVDLISKYLFQFENKNISEEKEDETQLIGQRLLSLRFLIENNIEEHLPQSQLSLKYDKFVRIIKEQVLSAHNYFNNLSEVYQYSIKLVAMNFKIISIISTKVVFVIDILKDQQIFLFLSMAEQKLISECSRICNNIVNQNKLNNIMSSYQIHLKLRQFSKQTIIETQESSFIINSHIQMLIQKQNSKLSMLIQKLDAVSKLLGSGKYENKMKEFMKILNSISKSTLKIKEGIQIFSKNNKFHEMYDSHLAEIISLQKNSSAILQENCEINSKYYFDYLIQLSLLICLCNSTLNQVNQRLINEEDIIMIICCFLQRFTVHTNQIIQQFPCEFDKNKITQINLQLDNAHKAKTFYNILNEQIIDQVPQRHLKNIKDIYNSHVLGICQKIDQFSHIFVLYVRECVFDYLTQFDIPQDYTEQNRILDELLSLKSQQNIYQIIGRDVYTEFLMKVVQIQLDLQQKTEESLQLDANILNNTTQQNINDLMKAQNLYKTHLVNQVENKLAHFKELFMISKANIDQKLKNYINDFNFSEIIKISKDISESSETFKELHKLLFKRLKKLYQKNMTFLNSPSLITSRSEHLIFQDIMILSEAVQILPVDQLVDYKIKEKLQDLTDVLNEKLNKGLFVFKNMIDTQQFEEAEGYRTCLEALITRLKGFCTKQSLDLMNNCAQQTNRALTEISKNINIKEQVTVLAHIKKLNVLKDKQIYRQFFGDICIKVNTQIEKEIEEIAKQRLLNQEKMDSFYFKNVLIKKYLKILEISFQTSQKTIDEFFQPIILFFQSMELDVNETLKTKQLSSYTIILEKYRGFDFIQDKIIRIFQDYADSIITSDIPNQDYQKAKQNINILSEYVKQFRGPKFVKFQTTYDKINIFIDDQYYIIRSNCLELIKDLDQNDDSLLKATYNFYEFTNAFEKYQTENYLEEFYKTILKSLTDLQNNLKQSVNNLDELPSLVYIKLSLFIYQEKIIINSNSLSIFEILNLFQQHPKMFFLTKANGIQQIIVNGLWTEQSIFTQCVSKKMSELLGEIQNQLENKSYIQIIEYMKLIRSFITQLSVIFKDLDYSLLTILVRQNYEQAAKIAEQFWMNQSINHILYQTLLDLAEFEKVFSDFILEIGEDQRLNKIIIKIEQHIENLSQQIKDKTYTEKEHWVDFAKSLIHLRGISYEIGQVHNFTNTKISEILSYHFKGFSNEAVHIISMKFRQTKFGMLIIQEHKQKFQQVINDIMDKLTEDQSNYQYVLNNLQGDLYKRDELSYRIQMMYKIRREQLLLWQNAQINSEELITKTLSLVKIFNSQHKSILSQIPIKWSENQKDSLIEICAYVCTVWSVISSEGPKDKYKILHVVQCSIIIRLLGIDTKNQIYPLQNHMAELKTGEGKSITLGITSIMFAFIGFKVECCCYSKYLSQRDKDDFIMIFEKFNLTKYINYDTFDGLFEKIINQQRDLRNNIKAILNDSKQISICSNFENQKSLLLIDEIDFFFSENFIGEVYPIALPYQNQQIIDIFKCIWNKRNQNLTYADFSSYPEYLLLFSMNPSLNPWRVLIDQMVKMMIDDVNMMDNHQYFIYTPDDNSKKLICYKQLDGISINTIKGYKTAFAYIQEWEKKNISEEVMNENLSLIFNIGSFSFAEIPKLYDLVLGISGTITDMSDYQKQKMKQFFGFNKQTIAPSAFGQSKLIFDKKKDSVILKNQTAYFQEIQKQIECQIKQNRPILVFFEKKIYLDNFKCFFNTKEQIQTLTEESNYKNHVICKTSSSKIITLATKSFGRGCDFICTDPEIIKGKGVHVIQTFFSDDLAEETQIKGRTARYSQNGSYSLILLEHDLVKNFNYLPTQYLNNINIYNQINQLRLNKQKKREIEYEKKLINAQNNHNISLELKNILTNYNEKIIPKIITIIQKLQKINELKINKINQYSFYNQAAGRIGIGQDVAELDIFSNPVSEDYDLGVNGQYNNYSLLIGLFHEVNEYLDSITNTVIPQLKNKGFKECKVVTTEQQFILELPNFDQTWVISGRVFHNPDLQNEFVNSVILHLSKQRGLMLWADNTPFVVHVNLILRQIPVGYYLQTPIHINVNGNDPGQQIIISGSNKQRTQFGSHFITTGLNKIYEGNTICSPQIISNTPKDNFGDLEIIGRSSANEPCIFTLPGNKNRGRIVFDCGFTKLYKRYWDKTAGTQRYVKNSYVWLYWREKFINID